MSPTTYAICTASCPRCRSCPPSDRCPCQRQQAEQEPTHCHREHQHRCTSNYHRRLGITMDQEHHRYRTIRRHSRCDHHRRVSIRRPATRTLLPGRTPVCPQSLRHLDSQCMPPMAVAMAMQLAAAVALWAEPAACPASAQVSARTTTAPWAVDDANMVVMVAIGAEDLRDNSVVIAVAVAATVANEAIGTPGGKVCPSY